MGQWSPSEPTRASPYLSVVAPEFCDARQHDVRCRGDSLEKLLTDAHKTAG